jgi:hypothetical protein
LNLAGFLLSLRTNAKGIRGDTERNLSTDSGLRLLKQAMGKMEMNKLYRIEKIGDITAVRFTHKPGLEDIRMSIDEAASISTSGLRLWDYSHCGWDLTSSQLQKLAEYAKTKFSPPSKVALVATKDLSFGISRIYEAFRKQEGLEIEVFRSGQDALNWLQNKTE